MSSPPRTLPETVQVLQDLLIEASDDRLPPKELAQSFVTVFDSLPPEYEQAFLVAFQHREYQRGRRSATEQARRLREFQNQDPERLRQIRGTLEALGRRPNVVVLPSGVRLIEGSPGIEEFAPPGIGEFVSFEQLQARAVGRTVHIEIAPGGKVKVT